MTDKKHDKKPHKTDDQEAPDFSTFDDEPSLPNEGESGGGGTKNPPPPRE